MKALNIVAERSIAGMIKDCATMLTVGSAKMADGTHVRAVVNRNTGKKYVLEGQLVRNVATGRFAKLSEALA